MIDTILDHLHSQPTCSFFNNRSDEYDEVKQGYERTEDVYMEVEGEDKCNLFKRREMRKIMHRVLPYANLSDTDIMK